MNLRCHTPLAQPGPDAAQLVETTPIRTLGHVQPHGVLLALQEPELNIHQLSSNVEEVLGHDPQNLLGRNLEVLLGCPQTEKIRAALAYGELEAVNPLPCMLQVGDREVSLEGTLHRADGLAILELELVPTLEGETFRDLHRLVKSALTKIRHTTNLQELSEVVVSAVRDLTGLDRVMFYRFNEQGNGTVLAEDRRRNLKPLLGLNFPALDIPDQARELFLQVGLRLIANTRAPSAALLPRLNPLTGRPLDLGRAVLRGVSPCHLEYLHNMGVGASMAIPLVKAGDLWGLIACHHNTPKRLTYDVRAACELIGQVVSAELATKHSSDDYEYQVEVNTAQTQLFEALSLGDDVATALVAAASPLLNLVQAGGAALLLDGTCTTVGTVPPQSMIIELADWLHIHHRDERLIHTDSLAQLEERYQAYKSEASGLLAIALSETRPQYILWFRPEVIQSVQWAGDPTQSIQRDSQGRITLSPRQSFELWKESVRFTSLPWKACEIEAALALRQSILRLNLRKADKLAQLNQALQASEAREREKAEALAQTLEKLQATHTQLVQTHTHLVQSEKMSSLGQLVAGVAHEINNPVNFIYGNLVHVENYVQELVGMLQLYADHYSEPVTEIQEHAEGIDLEFLLADLPKMLGSMRLGASRIREIVQSLRTFSRLDESETKAVDIHEGINSTLLILSNRLKARPEHPGIQVVQEFEPLPAVECYPGPLNQVFMNLLANAIDAIEEQHQGRSPAELKAEPGQITIRTTLDPEGPWAHITITDNGGGIPEAARDRLFDPFFTTKPVGKGTGMGLAISFQIVTEKHGGRLRCESEPGRGTTFHIEIPLRAQSTATTAA